VSLSASQPRNASWDVTGAVLMLASKYIVVLEKFMDVGFGVS